MPTYQQSADELRHALSWIYDDGEAAAITNHVLQHITGVDRLRRMELMQREMPAMLYTAFNSMKARLAQGEPFQYVVGQELFLGRSYKVSPAVLIPRPETEELVMWVNDECNERRSFPFKVLEVGTGSGCIAVSLKCNFPEAEIVAIDISEAALEIAMFNAAFNQAEIGFQRFDFLNKMAWKELGMFQIIISNPPYIPETERESLHANVRDHEPDVALFVPCNDALLFYRTIAEFGQEHLAIDGAIYCELHRDYAMQTAMLFKQSGYSNVTVRNDIHGAPRMLKAMR